MIKAYAAFEQGGDLQPYEYSLPALKEDEIEVEVDYCGICHSDLSMVDNDWGISQYPLVPGHEIIGKVSKVGPSVTQFKLGDTVGVGWHSAYCNQCNLCHQGDKNLCGSNQATIVGRYGGFAEKVVVQDKAAVLIPSGMDKKSAAPLLCGGVTVFNPFVQFNISPTQKVAVIGLGGLGHLAVKFAKAWGCQVTVFTSNSEKVDFAKNLGADEIVDYTNENDLDSAKNQFDLIISTVNLNLNWPSIINTLTPKGRLHIVGVPDKAMNIPPSMLISGQRSVSGSPVGSPNTIEKMLAFAQQHKIEPSVEYWPLAQANEALDHLRQGKARYRIVLTYK